MIWGRIILSLPDCGISKLELIICNLVRLQAILYNSRTTAVQQPSGQTEVHADKNFYIAHLFTDILPVSSFEPSF